MSLLQLLTVGQSLQPIKDRPSRYRMRQQSLLPKFGPPASTGSVSAGIKPGAAVAEQAPAKPEPQAQAGAQTQLLPNAMNESASAPTAPAPVVPAQAYPAGRWTLPFKKPFHRSSATGPAQGPVQGELSLETVQPVRNDLSDSDLEVVPAVAPVQAGTSRQAASPKPSVGLGHRPSALWGWLRMRLLRRLD